MSEEKVGVEFVGNSLMLGKLLAVVSRQRVNAGAKGVSKEIMVSETACAVLNGT